MMSDFASILANQQLVKTIYDAYIGAREPLEEMLRQLPAASRTAAALLRESDKSDALRRSASRGDTVERLHEAYQTDRLVLVLGAGVSVDHNLPNWNTLLQRLLLAAIASETGADERLARVLANAFTAVFSPNPLIAARYLHNFYHTTSPHDPIAFDRAIRDAMYEELDLDRPSPLLDEIRQLCIAAGRSATIDSVITYNYDDLVEHYLECVDLDLAFRPVFQAGTRPKQAELPIYHVHGYLPRNGTLSENNRVALADVAYHEQYMAIYRWSNLVQINKFADHPCLFIGVSFSDPNLRRTLDIARELRGDAESHPHFTFRRRYDPTKLQEALERVLDANPQLLDEKARVDMKLTEVVEHLAEMMERFEENDLRSFGVNTLWIDDFDEIPAQLKDMRRP